MVVLLPERRRASSPSRLGHCRSRPARRPAAGIKAGEPVPLWKKIVAGGGAGAIAAANPNPNPNQANANQAYPNLT